MYKFFSRRTNGGNKRHLRATTIMVIVFFLIIMTGTFLLTLPVSARSGQWTPVHKALLTATSATCVTGLVVYDTYQYFTFFGQLVILSLIQVGGLGFVSFATLAAMAMKRNISMRQRILIAESYGLDGLSGNVRLMRHVLFATLAFEGTGAVILSARFIKDYGFARGVWRGIFHSVSAFCNAGFDILGDKKPFSNLTNYYDDITVNIVIMSLIVIGGLGFFVWEDIFTNRKDLKKTSFYTKMVLKTTAILIVAGAAYFFIAEYNNPGTMGNMSMKGKVLSSFFASVTPRTAGYNTISMADASQGSVIVTMLLMFIGGSSGSTAGGIKTVTFAVLMITAFQVARGRSRVTFKGRTIDSNTILRAFTITTIGLAMVMTGAMVINALDGFDYIKSLYECISAFGTVGLTLGITPHLSPASCVLVSLLMYFGRVGIFTVTYSIMSRMNKAEGKIKYPECKLMIG